MLVVVAHAVVDVQECLVRIVHQLGGQRGRLLLRQRYLPARVLLSQQIDEGTDLLVGLVPLLEVLDALTHLALL